jgi:hypothetical protein
MHESPSPPYSKKNAGNLTLIKKAVNKIEDQYPVQSDQGPENKQIKSHKNKILDTMKILRISK